MTKIEARACTMQVQKNRPMTVLVDRIGYILYFRILATAGATNLLLVTFLIPVSAILLSVTVLGEALLPQACGRYGLYRFRPCRDRRASMASGTPDP